MPIQLIDSTELLDNGDALRQRAAEDGYLFFKRLIPTKDILDVRADVLGVVERHGWLRSEQSASGGMLNREAFADVPESDMRTDIGVSRSYVQRRAETRSHASFAASSADTCSSSSACSTGRSWSTLVISFAWSPRIRQ